MQIFRYENEQYLVCYRMRYYTFSACISTQGCRNESKSGTAKRGVLGVVPPVGMQGTEPLGGGQGAKPPEASAFSKMRLEFVQHVDDTMITKLLMKRFCFFHFLSWKVDRP